jgi:hypothetical protein
MLLSAFYKGPSGVVNGWLETIGMTQYTENFLRAGYFDVFSIQAIEEIDLTAMEVADNHIPVILEACKKEKKLSTSFVGEETTVVYTKVRACAVASISLNLSFQDGQLQGVGTLEDLANELEISLTRDDLVKSFRVCARVFAVRC